MKDTRSTKVRIIRRLAVGTLLLGASGVGTSARAQTAPDIAITRASARTPQLAPNENFTGVAHVSCFHDSASLAGAGEGTRAAGGTVAFEPGARTAWHTHPAGQTLIVTAGVGRVQRWDAAAEEIRAGDVVWIPAGVKHWHGAAPTSAMTHIALADAVDGRAVEWLERVSDAQYAESDGQRQAAAAEPSAAQRLMGDIAPKLADLTDSVLYADVWARPGLSPRDRSLATVSALIAMNRPDQLRSHLALALRNGVTQEELIETITHLAFYAGWPSAVTAIGVARDVFAERPR
jgi:4-carboxymuconolactone decarboxylase